MIAVVPLEQINRWRMEKCDDTIAPVSIEHARFLFGFHADHGCRHFVGGVAYTSVVVE